MPLKNFKKESPICCEDSTTIKEVARMMKSENVGAILVLKGMRPVGIVTDRDLAIRCVADGMDCTKTPVGEVMTKTLATVSLEDGVHDVVEKMKSSRVRRIPVVDGSGYAVGIITTGDVLDLLSRELSDVSETIAAKAGKLENLAA